MPMGKLVTRRRRRSNFAVTAVTRPRMKIDKIIRSSPSRFNSSEGMHICSECTYKTKFLCNLKRHQRKHTGEVFRCRLCTSIFYDSHELAIHTAAHSGQLSCKFCGKTMASRQGLQVHQKRHLREYQDF